MYNSRYGLFIEKERGLEDNIRKYKSYVNEHYRTRQVANWENKTSAAIYKNQEQEEREALNNQKEIFLNMRRNKLSNLLKKENEQYHRELFENQDTPENQRAQMEKKLQDLKDLKENEKKKFVEEQKEKQFYNENDDVRKYNTEYNSLRCCIEQENQMIDKMHRRYRIYQQEKAFDDVNKMDYLKKVEREKKELLEIQRKNKELNDYREYQRQKEKLELERINKLNEIEKQKLNEQWRLDEENELKQKKLNLELNKKI